MEITEKSRLDSKEKKQIYDLWNREYPAALSYSEIAGLEEYLAKLTDQYHILLKANETVIGWYFDFIRNDERWFAIILTSEIQGRGYGSLLLKKARDKRLALSGWVITEKSYKKINGEYYKAPVDFYSKNGFDILPDVKLVTDTFSAIKIRWKRDDLIE